MTAKNHTVLDHRFDQLPEFIKNSLRKTYRTYRREFKNSINDTRYLVNYRIDVNCDPANWGVSYRDQ